MSTEKNVQVMSLDDAENYIEENLDEFIDSLTKSQKKALDRWMDIDEEHGKIKEIKDKIKLFPYP